MPARERPAAVRTALPTVSAAVLLLVGLLAAVAPGAPAHALEMPTARGPVAIEGAPRRVAVYDIAAADTLVRLGVVPQGLPEKLFVPELEAVARAAEPVGTVHEPDLEALSALGPDLVIVGLRSSPRLEAVRRVAPAIDMSIDGRTLLADMRRHVTAYGALFDRREAAERALADLARAAADARAAAAGKGNALILMANGPKISAYGAGSRFGWLHGELGIPPAAPALTPAIHGEVVSFEFVRKTDPDWLVVLDRGAAIGEAGAGAAATLDNELVAGTKAGKAGRIVQLPPADAYIAAGGVSATIRVLERITAAFRAAP